MAVRRREVWSAERWERIAPLSGVIAVVLVVVGVLVHEAGDRPGAAAPAHEFVTYFQEEDRQLDPGAAQALALGGDGIFYASFFTTAVLLLATAIVGLRTRVLPKSLAWVTLVLAVALLAPWVNWFVWLFLFPLWILLLSVWMWRPFALRWSAGAAPPPAA